DRRRVPPSPRAMGLEDLRVTLGAVVVAYDQHVALELVVAGLALQGLAIGLVRRIEQARVGERVGEVVPAIGGGIAQRERFAIRIDRIEDACRLVRRARAPPMGL